MVGERKVVMVGSEPRWMQKQSERAREGGSRLVESKEGKHERKS